MMTAETDVREYELSFLLNVEEAAAAVEEFLISAETEIVSKGPLRTITLSYPIKKQETAFWGFLVFRALPEKIAEIRKAFHLHPQILRFLILTPPIMAQEARRRGEAAEKPETITDTPITERFEPPVLSNEALEKQIEEILG